MKKPIILSMLMALPAIAGTSAPSSKEVIAPTADPCLFTWFAGGSVGYLTEFEEAMYTAHVGTDTCWNVGGWNIAFFAEIGYTEKDESFDGEPQSTFPGGDLGDEDFDLDDVEDVLSSGFFGDASYDLEIIPITGNIKFERQLAGNLNAYVGAGLGVANVDLSIRTEAFGEESDDDWVFVAQAFGGLVYNVTQNFEVFGGARWIYFDDAEFGDGSLQLDDDFLLELGGRFNF